MFSGRSKSTTRDGENSYTQVSDILRHGRGYSPERRINTLAGVHRPPRSHSVHREHAERQSSCATPTRTTTTHLREGHIRNSTKKHGATCLEGNKPAGASASHLPELKQRLSDLQKSVNFQNFEMSIPLKHEGGYENVSRSEPQNVVPSGIEQSNETTFREKLLKTKVLELEMQNAELLRSKGNFQSALPKYAEEYQSLMNHLWTENEKLKKDLKQERSIRSKPMDNLCTENIQLEKRPTDTLIQGYKSEIEELQKTIRENKRQLAEHKETYNLLLTEYHRLRKSVTDKQYPSGANVTKIKTQKLKTQFSPIEYTNTDVKEDDDRYVTYYVLQLSGTEDENQTQIGDKHTENRELTEKSGTSSEQKLQNRLEFLESRNAELEQTVGKCRTELHATERELRTDLQAMEKEKVKAQEYAHKRELELDDAVRETKNLQLRLKASENKCTEMKNENTKRLEDNRDGKKQMLESKEENERLLDELKTMQIKYERLEQDFATRMNIAQQDILESHEQQRKLSLRISQMSAERVGRNNPNLEDLGSQNRSLKIAEEYIVDLYGNKWCDALETLLSERVSEERAVKMLCDTLVAVYQFCCEHFEEVIQSSSSRLTTLGKTRQPDVTVNITQTQGHCLEAVQVAMRDYLRDTAMDVPPETLLQLFSVSKHSRVQGTVRYKDRIVQFVKKAVTLCWRMVSQDPPMALHYGLKTGDTMDENMYKPYNKAGGLVDFLVWPALLLYKSGDVLEKGTVNTMSRVTTVSDVHTSGIRKHIGI